MADQPSATSALPKYLGRAAMVVASVVLTLGLAEVALRITRAAPLPETASGGFRADHPLLRLLRPSECKDVGALDSAYSIEVCTNQLGLRDRDHTAGEAPRVIALGDSFTFGWGVERQDTYVAHLERALRLAMPEKHAGVWAAGLSYTSQVHQDVLLRYLYDKVKPDAVVLAFAEDNDIDENIVWNPNLGVFPERGEIAPTEVTAYRDAFRGVVFQDFLFRNSALVRFFRQRRLRASMAAEVAALDSRLEAHGFTGAPLSRMVADEARRRFLQAFSRKYDDDWRMTEILLDRIQGYVAERGGKLLLLRIPSRMSVEDASWTAACDRFCGTEPGEREKVCGALDRRHTARRLSDYAGAHGLVYIDPEGALRSGVERGETLYIPDDIHLSRLGHARLAEPVAQAVIPFVGGKAPPAPPISTGQKQRQVGAYWYPWYRADDWSSFTDYTPKGGAYLSTNTAAIQRQIHQAERAELDFLMIELLADHNPESKFNNDAVNTMVNAIVERRRRGYSKLSFAMLTDIFVGEADIATTDKWLEVTRRHLDQIWQRFVEPHRDAYVQVNGKPLLGIFSPAAPIDDPRYTIVRPYWVSHEQWKDWDRKRELVPFWDMYPQTVTDPRFMSVIPGYNDWRLERQPQVGPYLPRLGGRTFVEQWRRVFETDPEVVFVYSFNEFFEQTQIQPTVEQGDRYLLLNQLLARRFKDGRSLGESDGERLVDVVEPPVPDTEEKVRWLPIEDPRLVTRGLEPVSKGRRALRDQAELEFDSDSQQAFVVGIAHLPSFERCAGLSVAISGAEAQKNDAFSTELTQLSILRDTPLAKEVRHVKLTLRRVPASSDCSDPGGKPIMLTGVTRYPLATAERLNLHLDDRTVTLQNFWDIESPPAGSFAWTRDRSSITVSGLSPGVRHKVTLSFRDTAGFGNVEVGPDPEHVQRLVITPGRTATLAEPLVVSPEGKLSLIIKSPTWRPHDKVGSEDLRTLGLALRLITLDRVEAPTGPHDPRH